MDGLNRGGITRFFFSLLERVVSDVKDNWTTPACHHY